VHLSFPVIFGLVLVAIMLVGCVFGYFRERSLWNNGVSPYFGTAWTHFDIDSQGGRGYHCQCRGERHTVWISWPVGWLNRTRK
jgi:hypothetical protein